MPFVSIPFSTIKSSPRNLSVSTLDFVSIPFSTIKSLSQVGQRLQSSVSIPFSTIKSLTANKCTVTFNSFQFHLVRLKGNIEQCKRKRTAFQFHLVRLKDAWNAENKSREKFQFHLVRLKELDVFTCPMRLYSFNSI